MFKEEKKLLIQERTETVLLELINSQDLFERYNQINNVSSSSFDKQVLFSRKPNDEKNNRWVYPFPRDIWDYWINQRFNITGTPVEKIKENDFKNYIDLPNNETAGREAGYHPYPSLFDQKTGNYSYIYENKYKRLWDFIYNPNFFLNPNLETAGVQRLFPFPRYGPDNKPVGYDRFPSLIPPFLPDVVYKNHPDLPYSEWQHSIPLNIPEFEDMLDPSTVLAQKIAFIRAYGSKPDGSLDMYEFDPVNITQNQSEASSSTYFAPEYTETYSSIPFANELLVLEKQPRSIISLQKRITFYQPQRPDFSKTVIYPRTSTYSPMPYAPIVIHDANNYDSAGWYYFFRQKVRRSSSFPFPNDEKTYTQMMMGVNICKKIMRSSEIVFLQSEKLARDAAMQVLPQQAAIYHKTAKYDPNTTYITDESRLSEEQKSAIAVINNLKDLIFQAINTNLYEPVFDKNGDPVYEPTPYKITTVYVLSLKKSRTLEFDFYNFKKLYTVTVPSFLNISSPGYIDVEKNNRNIEWKPQGLKASLITIDLSRGTNNHIGLTFKIPGKYTIVCEIQQRSNIGGFSFVPNTIYYVFIFGVCELFFERIYRNPLNTVIEPIVIEAKNIPFQEEASVLPSRLKNTEGKWEDTYFASPLLTKSVSVENFSMENIVSAIELIYAEIKKRIEMKLPAVGGDTYFFKKSEFISSDSPVSRTVFMYDPTRPFLITRHTKNPFRYYLFAVIYETGAINIDYFGTRTVIPYFIPVKDCHRSRLRVSLSNFHGEYLVEKNGDEYQITETNNAFSFIVNHPEQLGVYFVNVHIFNDTCDNLKDETLLYSITYKIGFSNENVDVRQLLFGRFDLDENKDLDYNAGPKKKHGFRLYREPDDPPYVFFTAMCRVYRRLYRIDLFNFALLYPYVVKYCQEMEIFIKHHDPERRMVVIEDVPSDLKRLVPSYLHPPYLFISVSYITNIKGKDSLYYVIFDPSQKSWINILSIENSATVVTDPRLCIPIEGGLVSLVSEISRYYFYVPINRHLFMNQNRFSQKKPTVSSTNVLMGTEGSNFSDISAFIIHVRKLFSEIENSTRVLSQQKIKYKTDFPAQILDAVDKEITDTIDGTTDPVFYRILRENEARFSSLYERLGYFFRLIREALKKFFKGTPIVNPKYEFKNPIHKLLVLKYNLLIPDDTEQFEFFCTHLYRIGYCDIGFMFLKDAYPTGFLKFDTSVRQAMNTGPAFLNDLRETLTSEFDINLRKEILEFVNSGNLYSEVSEDFDFLYQHFINAPFVDKIRLLIPFEISLSPSPNLDFIEIKKKN